MEDLETNVSSKWKTGTVSSPNTGAGHLVLLGVQTEGGLFLFKIIH